MRRILLAPVVLVACGYSPATVSTTARVAAVESRTPHHAIATCLTRELREAMAARARRGAEVRFRLEAVVLDARAEVGDVARARGRSVAVEERAGAQVRVRLIDRATGATRWGPAVFRARRTVAEGPTAPATAAGVEVAWEGACNELARRVADEVGFFLVRFDHGREDRPTPGR